MIRFTCFTHKTMPMSFFTAHPKNSTLPLGVVAEEGSVPQKPRTRSVFGRFAWGVLWFNFIVIAIGVVVRATGSGDGCGAHWPLCNGEAVPVAPVTKTVIEFTHRVFSGIDGPLILALVWGGFRLFPKNHPMRKAVIASLVFTGIEAWIGKYLVQARLVAHDASPERAVWMSIHLLNTFFLLTCLTLSAWWASGRERITVRGQGAVGAGLCFAFLAMMILGVSGAVTALGDTLFPIHSHAEAVQASLTPGAHFLVRLRLLHPLIAGSVGLYLLLIAGLTAHLRPSTKTRFWAGGVGALFLAQVGVGFLNVGLLAPVWMQVIHLVMADAVWVVVSLMSIAALAINVPHVELGETATPQMTALVNPDLGRAGWRDYLILTKPKVISLLLLTTIAAAFIAAKGWPGLGVLLAISVGGYLSAGAGNAINMIIDRDIDGQMERTQSRPTVTQKIPSSRALAFALTCALASFAVLWLGANLLSAMLSLAGLTFYVVVYTLLLKRRTWHNIVIGGAAGAFPPLVGWAAVTGTLSPLALFLFAIVFLWTPAHFWALALLPSVRKDYASANVPMLTVVRSDKMAVTQIVMYAILTAVVSVLPLAGGWVGFPYIGVACVLNVFLIIKSVQLFAGVDRPRALSAYKYSMLYLALLFVAMAIDRAVA